MKSYAIVIKDNPYSESVGSRCISSAKQHGLQVEKFDAVVPNNVDDFMQTESLSWTWADMNTKTICSKTGLEQFPYRTKNLKAKIACSLSHYVLWKKCVEINEDLLILEHDAVFVRSLPDISFCGSVQINDPEGGGYNGKYHSRLMKKRKTEGVFPLTRKRPIDSKIPDGFSGNSAYIVKPWAAQEFINAFKEYGVWPNDATICLQLFPWLEEYYPFVTVVKQSKSTTQD